MILGLFHGNDFHHLGDLFLDDAFDAGLEGEGGHRTAVASAFQPYFDHIVLADIHQFNVTAVGLDGGADLVQYGFFE